MQRLKITIFPYPTLINLTPSLGVFLDEYLDATYLTNLDSPGYLTARSYLLSFRPMPANDDRHSGG